MTRVLYVESAAQAGGSTVSLFELLRRIDRRKYDPVVLLCASNPYRERFAAAGIRVISTPAYCSVRSPSYSPALGRARRSSWSDGLRSNPVTRAAWRTGGLALRTMQQTWPLARDVQRIVRENSIDLLHLNDAPELHKSGIIAARLAGKPSICHVRSMAPLDALDRRLAHWVSHFIFISKAVEADQRQRGLGRLPGSVVYNGLDLTSYASLDRLAARQAFGLVDDKLVVGMIGRIEPWKGQRELLAAIAQLAPKTPALRCLIAGAPELDGAWFLDELHGLVQSLGLGQVVRLVGHQEAPHFLAALDVLVHASVQPEPFGRVLIEGMAAGLPLVATNAGGVPEIVIDGETGLLVPPADPTTMAEAIARLLTDRDLAASLGRRGRERAAHLFSIESHVSAVQDIYEKALAKR